MKFATNKKEEVRSSKCQLKKDFKYFLRVYEA